MVPDRRRGPAFPRGPDRAPPRRGRHHRRRAARDRRPPRGPGRRHPRGADGAAGAARPRRRAGRCRPCRTPAGASGVPLSRLHASPASPRPVRGLGGGEAARRPGRLATGGARRRGSTMSQAAGKEAAADAAPRDRVLLVTGMSGAGHSTALKALEDLGYEAVDNLPLSLVPSLMSHRPLSAPLAVGADVRTRDFGVSALADTLVRLDREGGTRAALVFLECGDDRLVERFTETRRRHPLALDRPVID